MDGSVDITRVFNLYYQFIKLGSIENRCIPYIETKACLFSKEWESSAPEQKDRLLSKWESVATFGVCPACTKYASVDRVVPSISIPDLHRQLFPSQFSRERFAEEAEKIGIARSRQLNEEVSRPVGRPTSRSRHESFDQYPSLQSQSKYDLSKSATRNNKNNSTRNAAKREIRPSSGSVSSYSSSGSVTSYSNNKRGDDNSQVSSEQSNIGPRLLLSHLKSDFQHNSHLVAKIDALSAAYGGIRRVRGDGNCYYRSCIFSLICQIIETKDRSDKFQELLQCFLCFKIDSIDSFLQALEQAISGNRWKTVKEFEEDVSMDNVMILACRKLVSAFLVSNKNMLINDLSIENSILPSHPEVSTIEQYCQEFVDKTGIDAEGPFVQIGVLFIALHCCGITVFLDRRGEVPLNFFEINPKTVDPSINTITGTVHLLLRPGHYDLLFPIKENREDGTPFYSAAELMEICSYVYVPPPPPPLQPALAVSSASSISSVAAVKRNDGSNQGMNSPGSSWSRGMAFELSEAYEMQLRKNYPSLCAVVSSNNNIRGTVKCLKLIPRIVLKSFFPTVIASNGLYKLQTNNPINTTVIDDSMYTKVQVLNATDMSEVLNVARASFGFPPERRITLTKRFGWVFLDCRDITNQKNDSLLSNLVFPDPEDISNADKNAEFEVIPKSLLILKVDSDSIERSHRVGFTVVVDVERFSTMEEFTTALIEYLHLPKESIVREKCTLKDFLVHSLLLFQKNISRSLPVLYFDCPKPLKIARLGCETIVTKSFLMSDEFENVVAMVKACFDLNIGAKLRLSDAGGRIIDRIEHMMKLRDNDTLFVNYCDNCVKKVGGGNGRKTGMDSLYRIGSCGHYICGHCVSEELDRIVKPRKRLGSTDEAPVMRASAFFFPKLPKYGGENEVYDFLPELNPMSCPCDGCKKSIEAADIGSFPNFYSKFEEDIQEMDQFIRVLKNYQRCCFSEILCGAAEEPMDSLMQLGCGHFCHEDCLANWLKAEIDKNHEAQAKAKPIVCYQCELSNTVCSCPICHDPTSGRRNDQGAADGHIITESEMKRLVAANLLAEDLMNSWQRSMTLAFPANDGEIRVSCNRCSNYFFVNSRETNVACVSCDHRFCVKCFRDSHDGMTCEEFQQLEMKRMLQESGEVAALQQCPFCPSMWGLPINCMHATCDSKQNGCGGEFCFPCAASRTPTVEHGMYYHRPQCPYYDTFCCPEKCIENGKTSCVHDKYLPGPCGACIDAKTINSCQHSEWRACRECERKERVCDHYCHECKKLGKKCATPGNPLNEDGSLTYRVLTADELKAEEQRMKKPDPVDPLDPVALPAARQKQRRNNKNPEVAPHVDRIHRNVRV